MKTALVTGSKGFIGTHLVNRLIAEGVDVIGVDLKGEDDYSYHGDVTDFEFMRWVMHEHEPDIVFHLAAQSSVPVSLKRPIEDARSNFLGTVTVIEAMKDAGISNLIYTASGGTIYGDRPYIPSREPWGWVGQQGETHYESVDWPTVSTPYALSKRAALEYALQQTDIDVSGLLLANVYGPGQDPHGESGVIAIFTEQLLRDEPCTIFGKGTNTRDYVHVDDVVEALICAPPGLHNISTGVGTSVLDILQLIENEVVAITGKVPCVLYREDARNEVKHSVLFPAKWFSHSVTVQAGIRRYVRKQAGL